MKLLAIDIETTPLQAYTWGIRDQNIGLNQIIEPTRVLCFGARFVGERKMHFHSDRRDGHEAMVQAAWDLLDEADALLHFNGTSFDVPHLKREFVQAGLTPPSPFQQVDLYRVVRRQFRFPSNKLAYVLPALGIEGKLDNGGFDLWPRCMAGDDKAWRLMERYCKRDVTALEELYERLLPWITNHPTTTLLDGRTGCPRCSAGPEAMQRRGHYHTSVSSYVKYRCSSCGSYSRGGKRVEAVDVRPIAA